MQPDFTPEFTPATPQPVAAPAWTITVVSPVMFSALCVTTLGLYALWWQFRAWQFFKRHDGSDIWPFVRAIFTVFTVYELLQRIAGFARENEVPATYSTGGMALGYIGLSIFGRTTGRLETVTPLWLLGLAAFAFLIPPAQAFRQSLLRSSYAAHTNPGYGAGHVLLLAAGLALWGLLIVGLMAGEA